MATEKYYQLTVYEQIRNPSEFKRTLYQVIVTKQFKNLTISLLKRDWVPDEKEDIHIDICELTNFGYK